jgi:hypothetical protein
MSRSTMITYSTMFDSLKEHDFAINDIPSSSLAKVGSNLRWCNPCPENVEWLNAIICELYLDFQRATQLFNVSIDMQYEINL